MIKIILDTLGADNPEKLIVGATLAINKIKNVALILIGNEKQINEKLSLLSYDKSRIEIVNANVAITNNENPTLALREKTDSSLVIGMNMLKNNKEIVALISAGSTGAVLVSSIFILGNMKGIIRPCLASVLPTISNGRFCLLDCGANSDCLPEYLAQFAVMGSEYMKSILNIEQPRVALLNVGNEDNKGNTLIKESFKLIKQNNVNFVGNMEARDAIFDKYDVIVSDGFSGNILLKSIEGTAVGVIKMMKEFINKNSDKESDMTFVEKSFKNVMNMLDYNSLGGAVVLGVNKIVIKAHGSANENTVVNTVIQALNAHNGGFIEKTKKYFN